MDDNGHNPDLTDVLVNSAVPELNLGKGRLSKEILEAAGYSIQSECTDQYPTAIDSNTVAITSPGNLQCKAIFHVTLPRWRAQGDEKFLYEVSLITIKKQFDKKRDTIGSHWNSESLLQNTFFKRNKYVVNQEIKHLDNVNFRIGDLAVTGGHSLHYKKVYHGCMTSFYAKKESGLLPEKVLQNFVTKCLVEATKNSIQSIAFPALGTGFLKFPPKVATTNVKKAIRCKHIRSYFNRQKRPPCKTCNSDLCTTHPELYDSVVAEFGRREFVVYDSYKCYPEYLITYK
ncbi:protein mono-ADP-ribosyltransferase PARP14-like [Mytilus galloprovincialis]|uniref:protein mono-ADP-ribosyltransferase PARP14-like n=1 Tax=Mytilus galloprovincialis TaxID=29158 RepID=UPI003F7BD0AE